jgi:hypothetical protein
MLESAAPGVAALLADIPEDGSRSVLDLGAAAGPSLETYVRHARHVMFADVLGDSGWAGSADPRDALLRTIERRTDRAYDLILGWDTLDRLLPEDRPRLVEWLAAVAAAHARLHVVVRGGESLDRPLAFRLHGSDRIRYQPVPGSLPGGRIFPAEVARLLLPFRVIHAYTLRSGLREYVALRR